MMPKLSCIPEEAVLGPITNQPGYSGVAGVLNEKFVLPPD